MADAYQTLTLERSDGIARVRLDHPPMNLLDLAMLQDLDRLGRALADDPTLRVAVFHSANPDYFIAHADVGLIQQLPREVPPRSSELSFFHAIVERLRTLPLATIGVVEGRARGGGSELLLSLDMRFGARGRARVAQPEVALGILPGGSGTQRLVRLMGRGRALEAILGCDDFDADEAERYGWINRALPPEALWPFVERLAARIASFPGEAIALAKAAVDAADPGLREGLLEEAHLFSRSVASEGARDRMQRFLESGMQDPARELDLGAALAALPGREGE